MSVVPSIKVSFYLSGDMFDLDLITQKVGIEPTKTRSKDSFPPTGLACTLWSIMLKEENCIAVSILFEKVLDILGGKESLIREMCDNYNLEASFEVVIHMKDGDSPEAVLPRKVISFASSINAEIGFDIYCYE